MTDAIQERRILEIKYRHVDDEEIVVHRIAPFDLGSTNANPKIRERNAEKVYGYSYTHLDDKTLEADPKVCGFNGPYFLNILPTDGRFDETELALLNLKATGYDYRTCRFALLSDRDWFQRSQL